MLQQSARDCLSRLRSAERAKGGVEEAGALNDLQDKLTDAARRIHETAAKAKVLDGAGISISFPRELAKFQRTIAETADRFRERPASTTIRQGKRLPNLLEAVAEAGKVSEGALTTAWTLYVGTYLFAGPLPDEEERTMAKTPKNRQALASYRQLFGHFAALRSLVPSSAQVIKDLKKLSSELAAIEFDRNVPAAVRRFLDETSTTTGASLDLLTDEVREWLKEQGLFGRYVIRSKVG